LDKPNIQERIEIRLDKSSECWLWTGAADNHGYGNIGIEGKTKKVHRAYWEEFNGPIPEGVYVCHTCDTPLCVNLEHLFLGTHSDNMLDMKQKGRHPGSSNITHCKQGHPLGKWEGKRRRCRPCYNRRSLESYHRRKHVK
jgi:hypothetical protein